jgi:hypothetical protein
MAVAGRGCDPFVPFLPLRAREASMAQAEWLASWPSWCKPVGAELAIHGGDLRHHWTVVVGHDRRSWRYDCSI